MRLKKNYRHSLLKVNVKDNVVLKDINKTKVQMKFVQTETVHTSAVM